MALVVTYLFLIDHEGQFDVIDAQGLFEERLTRGAPLTEVAEQELDEIDCILDFQGSCRFYGQGINDVTVPVFETLFHGIRNLLRR